MARFSATVESSTAIVSGTPSGATANGWFASVVAGASANFKLRRAIVGVRAGASVPTSQQVTVALYRQTTRATGTLTTATGGALDPRSAATAISGVDTAFTTNAPVVGATALHKFTFNTQSGMDIPAELLEEWICDQGAANGLAFVNIGNTLPASHLYVLSLEWEE